MVKVLLVCFCLFLPAPLNLFYSTGVRCKILFGFGLSESGHNEFGGNMFFYDPTFIFFTGTLAFHLITLPVEYDASHRALKELSKGIVNSEDELKGAKAVLNAAALTYVASTLMALVQLIRMLILRGSRN